MKNMSIFFILVLGFFHCHTQQNQNSNQSLFDLSQPVTSDDILFRYYCINRLEGGVKCLSKLSVFRSLPCALNYSLQDHKIYLGSKVFFNKYIVTTIVNMKEKKSIEPLFGVWKRICHYRYLDNSNVVTEFTSLLVYLLYSTLQNKFPEKYDKNKNLALLDALEDMDLGDILDILDKLVEEIPELIEKYDFDSDMGWYKWGKRYFIPAALSAVLLGIKAYLLYQAYYDGNTDSSPIVIDLTAADLMKKGAM